jgi:hypothetical protein
MLKNRRLLGKYAAYRGDERVKIGWGSTPVPIGRLANPGGWSDDTVAIRS